MPDEPDPTEDEIRGAFNATLEGWIESKTKHENREMARLELARRKGFLKEERAVGMAPALKTDERSAPPPFDPRTEVSADAKYIAKQIVTQLWVLLILLPIAAAVLMWFLRVVA